MFTATTAAQPSLATSSARRKSCWQQRQQHHEERDIAHMLTCHKPRQTNRRERETHPYLTGEKTHTWSGRSLRLRVSDSATALASDAESRACTTCAATELQVPCAQSNSACRCQQPKNTAIRQMRCTRTCCVTPSEPSSTMTTISARDAARIARSTDSCSAPSLKTQQHTQIQTRQSIRQGSSCFHFVCRVLQACLADSNAS